MRRAINSLLSECSAHGAKLVLEGGDVTIHGEVPIALLKRVHRHRRLLRSRL